MCSRRPVHIPGNCPRVPEELFGDVLRLHHERLEHLAREAEEKAKRLAAGFIEGDL